MTLEIWQAVVLGIVEGVTEYLPISSTGHLIVASALMKMDSPEHKTALDAFMIIIQGGAILAVLGLYWPRVVQMLRGLVGKDPKGLKLVLNLFVAFLPAAVIGKLLDEKIEAKLFYVGPVVAALGIGGIYMILVDRWSVRRFGRGADEGQSGVVPEQIEGGAAAGRGRAGKEIDDLTMIDALKIGLLQCVAMWPGTSRSMMTITGGMFCGLRPARAAEFSFLLGLPTLGAATVYKLYKNVSHAKHEGGENLFHQLGVTACVVGIVAAAISAAIAVRWLVGFLNKHGLTAFGIYRLALCAVLVGLSAAGMVKIAPKGKEGAPVPEVRTAAEVGAARVLGK